MKTEILKQIPNAEAGLIAEVALIEFKNEPAYSVIFRDEETGEVLDLSGRIFPAAKFSQAHAEAFAAKAMVAS